MIKDMLTRKSRRNETRDMKPRRSIIRRFESMSGNDREAGKKLDNICSKQSEREFDRVEDACKALRAIERDAARMGYDFKVNDMSVDAFCDSIELEDGEYLKVSWIDGEPGDSYCLTVHSWDDDDMMELAGDFYFDEK